MPTFLLLFFSLFVAAAQPPPDANQAVEQAMTSATTHAPRMTEDELPAELKPWVGWITAKNPSYDCPLAGSSRSCIWPGGLTLQATNQGASMSLAVTVDRDIAIPLPGGTTAWPQSVRVDGQPAVVLAVNEAPMVSLAKGTHTVTASWTWKKLPQRLPVPSSIGTIRLSVNGTPVDWPRIDEQGLSLGAAEEEAREGERLDLDVSRKISDALPVVVSTKITVRAAGSGREVNLGQVMVPGTRPTALSANLPARFDDDGNLVVQLRPGTYNVSFDAVHDGAVAELARPNPGGSWPEVEYWAVQTDDTVRAVNLSGPTGVDAARTTLPDEWKSLPAFSVTDTPLAFEELRRGEPSPSPNQLQLTRTLWLDTDGKGLTVRDRFTGTMAQGWRLDVQPSMSLGHAVDKSVDQVISSSDGNVGIELRSTDVQVTAESRIEGAARTLDAVGWNADVTKLDATLYLPPGWTLLAGTGVDNLSGSLLDRWTLFDLFFVLVLAMAAGKLLGWHWAAVTLLGLTLARHESGSPQWIWVVLISLTALLRVVPEGIAKRTTSASRWVAAIMLVIILAPFAKHQLQVAMFPSLEHERHSVMDMGLGGMDGDYRLEEVPDRFTRMADAPAPSQDNWASSGFKSQRSAGKVSYKGNKYLTAQVDPGAVVQTGPGIPNWTWNAQPLKWNGPVSRDHTVSLLLIGPLANGILGFLRVGLLLALAIRLLTEHGIPSWLKKTAPAAVAALIALTSGQAQAAPDAAMLTELEQRLMQPPICAPNCITVPSAALSVTNDVLTVRAEVHAAIATSWPVPGPANAWTPATVTLDGATTTALRRRPDGSLHVRVPAGVHTIAATGPLPPADAISLGFGIKPLQVSWQATNWALDGLHADGTVESSVQLARLLDGANPTGFQSSENLTPWFEVHRHLDLGIPWRVLTTVVRKGPADHPLNPKIPLLPGEAVTDSSLTVTEGAVVATLDRDQQDISWVSTLQAKEALALTAPTGVPWTEQWTVSCSPVFRCSHEGPAPLRHTAAGEWSPMWRVWPGETVNLTIQRPAGIEGATTTIDNASLDITPGRRQTVASLTMSIRSSQGGRQILTLPEGSALQSIKINAVDKPMQPVNNELAIPLQPGTQNVVVKWQQPRTSSVWDKVPEVNLGGSAVNATVTIHAEQGRWIVALLGPRWGPVPLFWSTVLLALLAAPILGRLPLSPLATWQWALLGLGMTQLPVVAPLCVVLWFLALAWRERSEETTAWKFNLYQLFLVVFTPVALLALYLAIHAGLLWSPDMQVAGNNSYAYKMVWFVDHIEGVMPRPTVVSLPLWSWRILMLIWSLWLAASMVKWLPWAWKAFSKDQLYIKPPPRPRRRRKAPAKPSEESEIELPAPEPEEA